MKTAFLQYLLDNHWRFIQHSKTARALLDQELDSRQVLGLDYSVVPNDCVSYATLRSYECWEDCLNRQRVTLTSRDSIGNEIYRTLVEGIDLDEDEDEDGDEDLERFKISQVDLDRRITANLLDGARMRSILFDETSKAELRRKTPHEHVSKKDFLTLRLYKLGMTVDFYSLTPQQHYELLQQFHSSTDRLLLQAGLPQIYAANPFDHMILTALCSDDPLLFIPELLHLAPRKGGDAL